MTYPIDLSPNDWEKWAVAQKSVYWLGEAQCVALMEVWAHDLRAPAIPCEYAYQMFNNAQDAYWEKILFSPNVHPVPVEGDILVIRQYSTGLGHVCMVRNKLSTARYAYTIDQNFSKPNAVSYETHMLQAYFLGLLRRKR
jgi:hypothetical protein